VDPLHGLRSMGRRITDPVEQLAEKTAEWVIDLVVRTLDVNALVQRVDPDAIAFVAWEFLYFGYSCAASGKSLGRALLGVKVVAADGTEAGPRRATIRTLGFPLSFLLCGLGFTGIFCNEVAGPCSA